MRILIVTNMYPTVDAPAAGIFVHEHVRALTNLGISTSVFFVNGQRSRSEYMRAIRRLARTLRSGGFDLVHTHHSYCMLQVVLVRPRGVRRSPVVFTMHEGESFLPPGGRDRDADLIKRLVYSKRIKRLAAGFSDQLVTVAPGLADAISFAGPYEVIPPGVDVNRFHPMSQRDCRDLLGLPQEKPIVFFPASPRRDFNKGYAVFRQAVDSLRIPMQVVLGGAIHPREMPQYMNAADVVVQTSRFEASPMVVKEAMACNRPLVSTDVGDVRELTAGLEGCLICSLDTDDVSAKIEKALSLNGDARGGRARILDLGLSLEAVAERYARLFKRVTESWEGSR